MCGITNNADWSEDDQIHCFKPHGPIPEGLEVLEVQSYASRARSGVVPENERHEQEMQMTVVEELPEAVGDEDDNERDEEELESEHGLWTTLYMYILWIIV